MTPEELRQAENEPLELMEHRIHLREQINTHRRRIPHPVILESDVLIRAHEAAGLGRAPVALYQRALNEVTQALRDHYNR